MGREVKGRPDLHISVQQLERTAEQETIRGNAPPCLAAQLFSLISSTRMVRDRLVLQFFAFKTTGVIRGTHLATGYMVKLINGTSVAFTPSKNCLLTPLRLSTLV